MLVATEAAAAPAVFGGGVPGGVVSIPLSSIIFLQLHQAAEKEKSILRNGISKHFKIQKYSHTSDLGPQTQDPLLPIPAIKMRFEQP